tara:strand:- start:51 stop:563 length:513 start_codon:yes stop_codon:yes gene_type:complete
MSNENYTLTTSQSFGLDLDKVFKFFSKPENLQRITPPDLKFKILTESPINMSKGKIIDYKINISFIPLSWKTLITEYNPPNYFIDKQVKGPYSSWIHHHTFSMKDGITTVNDKVKYNPPFFIIGHIVNKIYIRNMLYKIFSYRFYKIAEIFKQKYPGCNIQDSNPVIDIV